MNYKLVGGIVAKDKTINFYFDRKLSFKRHQAGLLELKEGWYAYAMWPNHYLLIEVIEK